jgi:nucleotide-binding universal stress UspA family protein
MKKILVPCDFSDTALQAFRYACEIATVSKGEIFLLNIIELPSIHTSLFVPVQAYESVFLKGLKLKAHKNFEKMKEKWAGKVKVHLTLEQGSVTSAIKKFVDRKRIDLIVMGTHGSSGIKEYAIGSNTEKIVRTSKVPVIAIKKSVSISSIKNLILPTKIDASKKLITSIKALQSLLKAHLHLLYVNTPSNFVSDRFTEPKLIELARQNQLKNCSIHIYNDIDEEEGITNFSAKFKNRMIAMSTHGRTGINRLMTGSITEDVVNHIDCPIWTISESN